MCATAPEPTLRVLAFFLPRQLLIVVILRAQVAARVYISGSQVPRLLTFPVANFRQEILLRDACARRGVLRTH